MSIQGQGTDVSRGGTSSRSIGIGQIKGVHVHRNQLQRYCLYEAGGPRAGSAGVADYASDAVIGPVSDSTGLGAAATTLNSVNYQFLPSFPNDIALRMRNATAMASVRGLGQANGGLGMAAALAAAEALEIMPGGARMSWRVVDPASNINGAGGSELEFRFKVRVRNSSGFAAGDLAYVGAIKQGNVAAFESATDLFGFKLQKGSGSEAQILTVTRQASGSVVSVDSLKTIVANATPGQGNTELEVRWRGKLGSVTVDFIVNGVFVKSVTLTTLAAGLYDPCLFFTAGGASTFQNQFVMERLELGSIEAILRFRNRN